MLLTGLALAFPFSGAVAGEQSVLAIHASGFSHPEGSAVAKLFRPGDNVLGRGRWEATATIRNGQASFQFRDLPAGTYAAVVFHDENGNGTIDHGAFGFPSEPLGFSNGFSLGVLSGLPSFDKLRFLYPSGQQSLEIAVR